MTRFSDCNLDETIVDQARLGHAEAQELIYRTFSVPVYNLALRLTGQSAAAEEILQDTFIDVLTKIDSFRGQAPLGAWIRKITVNKCLMLFRSGWHRKSSSLESMKNDNESIHVCKQIIIDGTADRMDLEKALDMLTPVSRTVVWLHDVEGYTHNEIGKLMGMSISFSKSQLARAHKNLQRILGNNSESEQQCMQLSSNY